MILFTTYYITKVYTEYVAQHLSNQLTHHEIMFGLPGLVVFGFITIAFGLILSFINLVFLIIKILMNKERDLITSSKSSIEIKTFIFSVVVYIVGGIASYIALGIYWNHVGIPYF